VSTIDCKPELSRIVIYPIKSFDGVSVQSAKLVRPGALQYDRRWALFDDQGRVMNGKRYPSIQRLRTAFSADFQEVSIGFSGCATPEAFSLSNTALLERRFSEYFDTRVTIRSNPKGGFPDDPDCPGPTLVSAQTWLALHRWFPDLEELELRRRFRTNLEVADVPPFWEDGMVFAEGGGKRFRLGDVTLRAMTICARCPVPARDSVTGEPHPGFQKEFTVHRQADLPPWAASGRFDHYYRLTMNTIIDEPYEQIELRVGDPLIQDGSPFS
jgi:uncharacterized protein